MDTQQLILNRNPFAAPTEEAIGADFIGRKSVLKEMHKYVINADKISNYHIVGLPRIGKSSLLKAFKAMVLENHYSHDLVVFYISLDECNSPNDMWRIIGKGIRKELKKQFRSCDKYTNFIDELEFEDVNENKIDYEYVCSVARCMKASGFLGLILIDEFDNFSTIATKGTVGQVRTLFSGSEFGLRAVVASRRMVERIEKEVEGALNSNVSILAPTFINGYKLKAFNEDDMKDYWATVEEKIGVAV